MTGISTRATALMGAVLLIAPLAVLSGAASTSAGAATPTHLLTCSMKKATEPSTYVLSCADANAGFAGMKWSNWGATSAHGHGILRQNDCTPNCVSGKVINYSTTVTLSKVVLTKKWGPLFSKAIFHYTANGKAKSETFGLAD